MSNIISSPFAAICQNIANPDVDGISFDYRLPNDVASFLIRYADICAEANFNLSHVEEKDPRFLRGHRQRILLEGDVIGYRSPAKYLLKITGTISDALEVLGKRPVLADRIEKLKADLKTSFDQICSSLRPLLDTQWKIASTLPHNNKYPIASACIIREVLFNLTFLHVDQAICTITTDISGKIGGTWLCERGEKDDVFAAGMGPMGPIPPHPEMVATQAAVIKGLFAGDGHQACGHTRPAYSLDEVHRLAENGKDRFRHLLVIAIE